MQSNVMQCKAKQCKAMPSNAKQCQVMQSNTTQCKSNAMQSNANQCLRVITNWGRAGLILDFDFSPIRLGLKGFLLYSKATGGLYGPVRAPGSLKGCAPPGFLGPPQPGSWAPKWKVKNVKKNPKCQKTSQKKMLNVFCWRFLAKLSKAKQRKAKQSKAKHSIAKQSKAKLSKAKQSIAKQSKTKHSKAKQS